MVQPEQRRAFEPSSKRRITSLRPVQAERKNRRQMARAVNNHGLSYGACAATKRKADIG